MDDIASLKRKHDGIQSADVRSTNPRVTGPDPSAAASPSQSLLGRLGHDVMNLILQLLHESHPESTPNVRLVSSGIHGLVECISVSTLELDLSHKCADSTISRLDCLQNRGLLAAVRTIKVTAADDRCECSLCAGTPSKSVVHLRQLFNLFSGLKDIESVST